MKKRLFVASNLFVITATLWAIASITVAAQDLSSAENRPDADNPQLHLSANKLIYRQGELIPLELSFSSRIPNRYQLDLARYDRSGRMNFEKFVIEPADGTRDPLLAYFKSTQIFIGGGLTNFQFLSDSPTVIHLDLNEWIQFDKPGNYRVAVLSTRAGAQLKSNSIDLQIIEPDSAWQEVELQGILTELKQPPPAPMALISESRYLAVRQLRYLGSADAAREMARRLRGEDADSYYMFGLIGSPNKIVGLLEMKKLLVDPDFQVSGDFLTAMAVMPLDPNDPPEVLVKQRDDNLKMERSALLEALSGKRGKAFAASFGTATSGLDVKAATESSRKYIDQLIESFGQLSVPQQLDWLDRGWWKVKDPKWLPTLRTIAAQYTDFPPPYNLQTTYQSLKLTASALTDWYELDPENARGAVIAEIIRPKPRYSANTLGLLPDETLSAQQQEIAEHFLSAADSETEGNLASLLVRYADATVLPVVLGKIQQKMALRHWECQPQNSALAYVQKVDPDAAKALLEEATCHHYPNQVQADHP
jgi:hypothetical protein